MPDEEPTDADVVETAAAAAEGAVFDHYRKAEIKDLDVTVSFEDDQLSVDIYLNPANEADPDPDEVVEMAVGAAEAAVDGLFAAGA